MPHLIANLPCPFALRKAAVQALLGCVTEAILSHSPCLNGIRIGVGWN